MTEAADLIEWCSGLTLRGGDHDGERFEVLPWERRFLRGAFGQPGDSALSIARGNGKTALVAAVASAVIDPEGPLHGTRREVVCVAKGFKQARRVFVDVLGFLRPRHDLESRKTWRKQDSPNNATLEHRASEATVVCIGSDPEMAHGARPFIALLDEPAVWARSTRDEMLSVLRGGLGKMPGSRLIALGTRSSDGGHWFSQMLAGGAGYAQVHAARPGDPPFQRRTWKRANPSLDHLPSLEAELRHKAAMARLDPALLAMFKAARLNLGVSDTIEAELIDGELWASLDGSAEMSGPVIWGVDMGGSAAMTAAAGYWPETGALQVVAAFPTIPNLSARGTADGVAGLYLTMERRGELLTLGGRAVDTAELVRVALARFGAPAVVVADAWRADVLGDALDAAGVSAPFVLRRMGPYDGGADVDAFRRACADGHVSPAESLLLRSAVSEARTVADDKGNQWLAKQTEGGRRLRHRDDAAAASVLAVAEGARRRAAEAKRRPVRLHLVG